MVDNPEWAKLIISALLGGGVASVFNYYTRRALASWKDEKEEKKLAYIYLIKLSYLVAFIRLMKKFVITEMQNRDTSKIDMLKNEDIEMSHQISILLADELNKLTQTEEFEKQISNLKEIENVFKDFIEFKIKEDLLFKMSKESILEYQLLTQSLDSAKYDLNIWIEKFKNKKNCEAFLVLQAWLVLKKINEHSENLFIVLLKKADINKREGEIILCSQLKELHESLMAGIIDKKKIENLLKKQKNENSS